LWSCDKSAHRSIFIKFVDNLYLCKPTTDGIKKTTKSYGNDANLMAHLPPLLETMNPDDNWEKKMQNTSLGHLLFNNGIYHFETNTFTEVVNGKFNSPEIFFHAKLNFDYCYDNLSEDMIEYMIDIRKRIFFDPLGEEQAKYFIELVSRAFAGNKMKKIIFGIGNGNNGKSIISSAINNSIGLYGGSFNAESLAYRQNSQDEASVMRWALSARYNRVLFSNELKTSPGKPTYLDANMMKKLSSGGDTLVGRGHYQGETEFIPHFLAFIFANDMVEIKPYDNALDNRLNIFHFKKQFVSNPTGEDELLANPNIVQEIETLNFKKCVVGIFIQAYAAFIQNGRIDKVPQSVLNAKSDWIPEDTSMIDKFIDTYEFTNDAEHFIFAKDIGYWAEQNKMAMSTTKIALEIKKYAKMQNYENVCNKDKKINGKKCVIWTGIRLYQYSEEEN
jgi:phage/plasmid-associated DNA primase